MTETETTSRTVEILAQKLAQESANHAYASALLAAAQQRERLLEREREELRQRVAALEARLGELEGRAGAE